MLRSVLVRRRGFKQATAAIARVGGQVLSAFLAAWGGIPTLSGKKKAAPLFILAAACFLVSSAGTKRELCLYALFDLQKQQLRLKRALVGRYLVATEETSLGEVLDLFQPPPIII